MEELLKDIKNNEKVSQVLEQIKNTVPNYNEEDINELILISAAQVLEEKCAEKGISLTDLTPENQIEFLEKLDKEYNITEEDIVNGIATKLQEALKAP